MTRLLVQHSRTSGWIGFPVARGSNPRPLGLSTAESLEKVYSRDGLLKDERVRQVGGPLLVDEARIVDAGWAGALLRSANLQVGLVALARQSPFGPNVAMLHAFWSDDAIDRPLSPAARAERYSWALVALGDVVAARSVQVIATRPATERARQQALESPNVQCMPLDVLI